MLKPKPKILSFILIAIMLAAALGGIILLTAPAAAEGAGDVVVCIGDSITEGISSGMGEYVSPQHAYPAQLSLLTNWRVINSGIHGQHTSQMLARFQQDVLDHDPERVIILGGTNDIYAGVSATTVQQNLDAMVDLATNAGATVYLLTIIPRNVYTEEMQIAADEVNAWIMAQGSASVIVVDTYTALEAPNTPDKLNFGLDIDGTHPNAIGMRAIVMEILKAADYPIARWTGAGADALASNPANWLSGITPGSGSVVLFDSGSAACTWDIATVYSLNSFGYSGEITQGNEDFTSGKGGLYMITGQIRGNLAQNIKSEGACGMASPARFVSNTVHFIMAGDLLRHAGDLQSVTFVKSCEWARGSTNAVTVNEGVTVRSTGANYIKFIYMSASFYWDNRGSIVGDGPLVFGASKKDYTIDFGSISAPITFRAGGSSTADRTVTLATDTVLSAILIEATHATRTMTLDMGGRRLAASDITVSTRGLLKNNGPPASCTVTNELSLTAASSSVSGPIIMSCRSLSIEDGAYVQGDANIWIGDGGLVQSGGTLTGHQLRTITTNGDWLSTGGDITTNTVNLVVASPAVVNAPFDARQLRFAADATWAGGHTYGLIVDNDVTVNIVGNRYIYVWPFSTYANNGMIDGDGMVYLYLYRADHQFALGDYGCELTLRLASYSLAPRTLTMTGDAHLAKFSVASYAAPYTVTLDLNGHSLTANGITIDTRGAIIGNGTILNHGDLDASAGQFVVGTSYYVQAGDGTIIISPSQSFHAFQINDGVTATLGWDASTIYYREMGELDRNGYRFTFSSKFATAPTATQIEQFDRYSYQVHAYTDDAQVYIVEKPSWLSWNKYTNTLSGKALYSGDYTVSIRADTPLGTEYQTFTIHVTEQAQTPDWSAQTPETDYSSIMLYVIVAAALGFILLTLAFMGRRR